MTQRQVECGLRERCERGDSVMLANGASVRYLKLRGKIGIVVIRHNTVVAQFWAKSARRLIALYDASDQSTQTV